jgi:hypothetical protein
MIEICSTIGARPEASRLRSTGASGAIVVRAGGAGIKVYTSTNRPYANQPLANFALLTQVNQVEPAISVGGGLKCMFSKHGEFRPDFRTYMTPLPNQVFRPTGSSRISGWLFDFVPLAGFSYTF